MAKPPEPAPTVQTESAPAPPPPTVGRFVHLHVSEADRVRIISSGANDPGTGPVAAVVVQVWTDTMVNLKALVDGPQDLWFPSVAQGGTDPSGATSYWVWPPRV